MSPSMAHRDQGEFFIFSNIYTYLYISYFYGGIFSGSGTQRRIGRPGNVSGVAAPPCGTGGG